MKYKSAVIAAFIGGCMVSSAGAAQRSYDTPPAYSSYGAGGVISDEQMKKCVEMYNHAQWKQEDLSRMRVNPYTSSQAEIDRYNALVNEVNRDIDYFNSMCAGKQSRSACEQANKLNRERGLPEKKCGSF